MRPLQVIATMRREVEWGRPVHLDGLLASVVARHRQLHRPSTLDEVVDIEIPIKRSECGRFHLASAAHAEGHLYSREQYIHRRAPHEWYTVLCGDKVKRVDISKEPDKSLRICKIGHRYQRVLWWCVGDEDKIRDLLLGGTRLGARRRHGVGTVDTWEVGPCSTWDGFPILRDGQPLRNLPPSHDGLAPSTMSRLSRLTYPYHLGEGMEMLCVPMPT